VLDIGVPRKLIEEAAVCGDVGYASA
jgi:hypothetical protein